MAQMIPPNNLEAEEAVLGSILIDPSVVNDVMEILRNGDFYSKKTSSYLFGDGKAL